MNPPASIFEPAQGLHAQRGLSGNYGLPPSPRGFRAEDFAGDPSADGFLPVPEAARAMGLHGDGVPGMTAEEKLLDLARRGLLEARTVGSSVYVRPAIVTRMGEPR
jgi:hypothetical protein